MEDHNYNKPMYPTDYHPYCNCCCCNAVRGQVGYGMQQFLPSEQPLNQQPMPQALPMAYYLYDIYGRVIRVIEGYPVPVMSLGDERFMQTPGIPEQNYTAENSELQNPSVSSITESGQPECSQEFVEKKSPPKPDLSATSVTSMPLSTEEPIMQSPKLSDATKANAVSEKKTKKGIKRKPKPDSSVSEETKKKKRKTDAPTDDTKANAVSEQTTKKGTKRKPKPDSSVSEETKKKKRKTDDPTDQTFAKKYCSKLQQKMLESINVFHALGQKTIVTSQQQETREPEEQAQDQRSKPSSPKRGQVKVPSNLPKDKCVGVKKESAPSLSKIAQYETPIQKSAPRSVDKLEELLEFSIPLPPEERETLKRKAQQEREEACQYTAKGRVQYFKQWQRDQDISLHYGYLPYLVHK